MPESKKRLELERVFSPDEYARIQLGLIPRQMEDKWFVYLADDWLHWHRSWTGVCVYQVRLTAVEGGYRGAETWVNRDPEQYKNTDDAYDVQRLHFLIERLLLGRQAPLPVPGHISQDLEPVYRHHVAGYGRTNDESP